MLLANLPSLVLLFRYRSRLVISFWARGDPGHLLFRPRHIADQHANFIRTIDSSIVQHLQKFHTEIKAHIKNNTCKLATIVTKERELSTSLISTLASSISTFQNTPLSFSVTPKNDPYVANTCVIQQLRKQVHAKNLLQKSIIITQANSAHFEAVVRAIQSA
ncbi:hypothetical protein VKT23_016151 [Stygiomarasmius scandens]|uniref:SLM1/RGC1-like BAR-like domain-containing protein n=1 Tax=Marasmiellus scandens TaxID=2682957 RepID=A0ABR1IW51_9AGAR